MDRRRQYLLAIIPLLVMAGCYLLAAWLYDAQAPGNRIVPMPHKLLEGVGWTLSKLPGSGNLPLVVDTLASLKRLTLSLVISALITQVVGLAIFSSRTLRHMLLPTIVILARVPAIALLPLLLVWMGFGEPVKILLVVLGITPVMIEQYVEYLDMQAQRLQAKVRALQMQLWQQWMYVWMPLALPYFISLVQSVLGAAWLFLLVAESFGTNEGLGYRIFVLRARLWMDIIIVYVVVIGVLAVGLYYLLELLKRRWSWTW